MDNAVSDVAHCKPDVCVADQPELFHTVEQGSRGIGLLGEFRKFMAPEVTQGAFDGANKAIGQCVIGLQCLRV